MQVERITPHIGARISGRNLAEVTPADREELRALLEEHLVLFFTGQSLTAQQFLAFGEAIGELEITPLIPSLGGDLAPIHVLEASPKYGKGEFADMWHTDVPFRERPPYATILRPEYLPSLGGDTLWASMYAAYEGLSDSLRRFADGLEVLQSVTTAAGTLEHVHPAVRVNPRTGRRGLYINSLFSKRIIGMSKLESDDVIRLFSTSATMPDYQVRHRWSPDVVAMWDNNFTQHYAVVDYREPRRMQRMTVVGEPVLGITSAPPALTRAA
ncbi:taurine dioxygenase [Sphingomonas sp. CL5.1]|uniref:TauD/TfdA dioxygenase family protein n=1 Tax=Sphingomonas sp. CL5.1 TaxID=2653203 RepID=UPI0015822D08|nr:TauD/TfdA family dioxygenase [Sphingomonas sp. CL5.1]QKR98386.1 taurine dioxygenase [Sphingomonas sp. CL5.1]